MLSYFVAVLCSVQRSIGVGVVEVPRAQPPAAVETSTCSRAVPIPTHCEFPSLVEIKNFIPRHCFVSNVCTSLRYLCQDFAICGLLCLLMGQATQHGYTFLLPGYWFLQGTMLWALFVIAHDCGHGSFSPYARLNDAVGLFVSSLILVPFASWKISHRHHHKNTGNIDKDEVFHPIRKKEGPLCWAMSSAKLYFGLGFAWFAYLLVGYRPPGHSHFDANARLFEAHRGDIRLSVLGVCFTLSALAWWISCTSLLHVLALYGVPLFVFASWLVLTTFLHHNDENIPWYSGEKWSYVKGNLSTVDRDYGIFQELTHHIGTHQVHHLFPIIPHYHLKEATAAFRKAFPHLARTSDEPILYAFHRIFHLVMSQMRIDDDVSEFVYRSEKAAIPAASQS